tara:strand:+ start:936 stop:1352 length:417 start_codon:yes stop_codon:yes gene_type:complete
MSEEKIQSKLDPTEIGLVASPKSTPIFYEDRDIQVGVEVDIPNMSIVSMLKCAYLDLEQFFGKPTISRKSQKNGRVIWTFKDKKTDIEAIIFDKDGEGSVKSVVEWTVGGVDDASIQVIATAFEEQLKQGKEFVIGSI